MMCQFEKVTLFLVCSFLPSKCFYLCERGFSLCFEEPVQGTDPSCFHFLGDSLWIAQELKDFSLLIMKNNFLKWIARLSHWITAETICN